MPDKVIDTPYDPDAVVGHFGWLWLDRVMDFGWCLALTFRDDAGQLRVTVWPVDWGNDPVECDAERFRGRPWLAALKPACDPGAGLLVTVRLPKGASLGHCWAEPGAQADAVRDKIIGALIDAIGECREPPL